MTPTAEERAEAAAIDVEGRQARIAEILQQGAADPSAENQAQIRPARAKRKDAGHPRPKKAEPAAQVAGTLSVQQVEKIRHKLGWLQQCQATFDNADRALKDAVADYNAYLDSLVSK